VPAHLVRAHRVVGARVEQRAAVVEPGDAVVDVLDLVVDVGVGVEVAEAHRVALVAGEVDGVREDAMVGRDHGFTEREEVVPLGEVVLVEHDLFVTTAAWPATGDPVLQTLDGPVVVLPRAVGHRRRLVRLLYAGADLLEDLLPARDRVRECLLGERVLGLQVRDHVGVGVTDAVPLVDAFVAVERQRARSARGDRRGRGRHCRERY
jgi:hypothetical protein